MCLKARRSEQNREETIWLHAWVNKGDGRIIIVKNLQPKSIEFFLRFFRLLDVVRQRIHWSNGGNKGTHCSSTNWYNNRDWDFFCSFVHPFLLLVGHTVCWDCSTLLIPTTILPWLFSQTFLFFSLMYPKKVSLSIV